jgi:hypothetical protein
VVKTQPKQPDNVPKSNTTNQLRKKKIMKCQLLASLVALTLMFPNVPASAGSGAELWNATGKTITVTICDLYRGVRPIDCQDKVYKGGEYSTLKCNTPVCTVVVQPANGVRYQKVRYTDGMGVTYNDYGLRTFVPK